MFPSARAKGSLLNAVNVPRARAGGSEATFTALAECSHQPHSLFWPKAGYSSSSSLFAFHLSITNIQMQEKSLLKVQSHVVSELDGLADFLRADALPARKIRHRACDLDDAVVGTRGKIHALKRHLEQALRLLR